MKKLIFGLGLLLSGVIGFVGWSIAVTQTVQPGARSDVFGCCDGLELGVLLVFVVMLVAGLIISCREFISPHCVKSFGRKMLEFCLYSGGKID